MSDRELRIEIKHLRPSAINYAESSQKYYVELAELKQQIATSLGLKCPNCDDVGFTVEDVQDVSMGLGGHGETLEQEQCEFCYAVPDSVFNRRARDEKGQTTDG